MKLVLCNLPGIEKTQRVPNVMHGDFLLPGGEHSGHREGNDARHAPRRKLCKNIETFAIGISLFGEA